jgi:hypothetical protein
MPHPICLASRRDSNQNLLNTRLWGHRCANPFHPWSLVFLLVQHISCAEPLQCYSGNSWRRDRYVIIRKRSKPSLIALIALLGLQLIRMSDKPDRNMENAVQSWVHILKRHIACRKADDWLVCSEKTWRYLQTCIITFENEYNFRVFYWWIDVLSC